MRPLAVLLYLVLLVAPASAAVTVITNPQQWQNAVGSYSTLTFADLPHPTQYSHLGITFTDGNDLTHVSASFPSDGHGLVSTQAFGFATITMSFAEPMYWLAFDYVGGLQVDLFNDGSLIFTSNNYTAGFTPFVGIVSTNPFDAAVARDHNDPTVAIDNIHFGPPIPAPGASAMLALAAVAMLTRRKRR